MNDIAIKLSESDTSTENSKLSLEKYFTEELIIGICGQLGTNLTLVTKDLSDLITDEFGYECKIIKMSQYISNQYSDINTSEITEYERIKLLMDQGNELRKNHSNQVLANIAISEIGKDRFVEGKEPSKFKSRRICYIINSLKHPAEYEILKRVYSKNFYLLSIFSTYDERCASLKTLFKAREKKFVDTLINRDTGEDIQSGQKVEDVFVKADYFIRIPKKEDELIDKLSKFFDLIFDYGINTPTKEENAMYQATAASVNSACLSRQVGACITDSEGEILSLGWNDVPSYGGGVYKTEHSHDARCFKDGKCSNSTYKDDLINNITDKLFEEKLVSTLKKEDIKKVLKQNGIKNLIEFSRSIHAEMQAIIIGSQKTGNKMVGGKLFCTTYPCHNCARHIILAGIKEVYFIEPYKKSLCTKLHCDAITEDENENNKVKILMYEGVAPKSFMKFYQQTVDDRKTKIGHQNKKELKPKHMISLEALYEREIHCLDAIKDHNLIDIGNN